MAINKAMKAALRAITLLDPDVKSTYMAERQLKTIWGKIPVKKIEYDMWDGKIPSGDYNVPVRIFVKAGQERPPEKALLFFHGGGWVTGNIDSYTRVCSVMAEYTDHMVVSVDYRLAPEHKFPTPLLDCYHGAETIYTTGLPGISPQNITLIGDSAGANLAAAVSLMARDEGTFAVPRQILLYPSMAGDHHDTAQFPSLLENGTDYLLTTKRVCDMIDLYKSRDEDLENPYFAPLAAADLSRQPDTLILTSEFDPLRDEGELYAKRLLAAGNRVQLHRMADALHGFLSLPPRFAHVQEAYEIINEFLR